MAARTRFGDRRKSELQALQVGAGLGHSRKVNVTDLGAQAHCQGCQKLAAAHKQAQHCAVKAPCNLSKPHSNE